MTQANSPERASLDLRLRGKGRTLASTDRARVENEITRDQGGIGFSWSLSNFQSDGPGTIDVESSREPSYVFTQLALDGAFEAELVCGAQYTSDTTGLVRPRTSSAQFRTATDRVRLFGLVADINCVEKWFGNKMPSPVRKVLNGAGVDTFYRPQSTPGHLKQTLINALASETPMRQHLIEASALQILAFQLETLAQLDDTGITRSDKNASHEAFARIAASADNPPTLNELAREFGIAPNRLDRAFRSTFGRSVYKTTADIRFDAICAALIGGEPIKVVAERFGYTSVSNFSYAFRTRMGAPPRRWLDQRSA